MSTKPADDSLPALKPLATLLAKREITASEFDSAVAYLAMSEDRRTITERRMPHAEGKILHNLLKLPPADAVRRAIRCPRQDVVLHLKTTLQRLNEVR